MWKLVMLVCRWSSSLGMSVLHTAVKMEVRAGHSGLLAILLILALFCQNRPDSGVFWRNKARNESFVSYLVFK